MTTRFEHGPPGYREIYGEGGPEGLRARIPVRHGGHRMLGLPRTRRLAAVAVGATAIGALALGAVAVGALAVSRLAIGRMALREGHVRSLTIDELRVRRLRVDREDRPEPLPRYAAARRT